MTAYSMAAAAAATAEAAGDADLFGNEAVDADALSSDDEDVVIIGGKHSRRKQGAPHDRLLQVLRGSPESVYSTFLITLPPDWEQNHK